ncbi:PqqD family protein [Sphingobacterium kyonggiense]
MKLRNDLTLRKVAGEYIIVDPGKDMVDMSKVFTFNETSALIWEELQGKEFSKDDIVTILLENYEVSNEIAQADAQILIDQFHKFGLII